MTIEITILISVVSVAFAIYFGLKSNRRNDTKDIEERVARETKVDIKLTEIAGDVKDIKYDITATKDKVNEIDRRLIKVEESSKSAHHRLDDVMKQTGLTDNRHSEE